MERAEEAIRRALGHRWGQIPVRVLPETDSTNLRLKAWYRAGQIAPPYLLTADSQTAGRGRLDRRFVSPPGTGLYMSLLASPPSGTDCGLITILAAVAVCRAIEEMTDLRPRIKWVNDLFVRGKKVCGILAEGLSGPVVIGIGVNLRTPSGGFPPEAGPAGALDADVEAPLLAGRIARYILDGLEAPDDPTILENVYSEVNYANVFQDVDFQYIVGPSELKENLILQILWVPKTRFMSILSSLTEQDVMFPTRLSRIR